MDARDPTGSSASGSAGARIGSTMSQAASPDGRPVLRFADAGAFDAWLDEHHAEPGGVWIQMAKANSGHASVSWATAVPVALCHGWIDGIMKGMDAERYAQRFTPRRKNSNWTETNKAIARRLAAEGRMTEAGRAVLPEDMV